MFQEEISIHNPFIIMRKIDFSNSFLGRKKNIQMYIPQVNLESQTNGSLTIIFYVTFKIINISQYKVNGY